MQSSSRDYHLIDINEPSTELTRRREMQTPLLETTNDSLNRAYHFSVASTYVTTLDKLNKLEEEICKPIAPCRTLAKVLFIPLGLMSVAISILDFTTFVPPVLNDLDLSGRACPNFNFDGNYCGPHHARLVNCTESDVLKWCQENNKAITMITWGACAAALGVGAISLGVGILKNYCLGLHGLSETECATVNEIVNAKLHTLPNAQVLSIIRKKRVALQKERELNRQQSFTLFKEVRELNILGVRQMIQDYLDTPEESHANQPR